MSRTLVDRRLEALADLLGAGLTPEDALSTIEEAGGAAGGWAREIGALARTGGLGGALAQHGALDPSEVDRAGGAAHVGTPAALAWVAHRRRTMGARREALWSAFSVPALLTVATALSTSLMSSLAGTRGQLFGDLLPLALVGGGVWVASARRVAALRAFVAGLPPFSALRRGDAEAELAATLAVGAAASEDFEAVARLVPEHRGTATRVARQLQAGRPLGEALPDAGEVGEPLALTLATGSATGDLPARLRIHAAAAAGTVTRRAAQWTRALTWLVLIWVAARSLTPVIDAMGNMAGATGLPAGLGSDGQLDDATQKQLEELKRELGL